LVKRGKDATKSFPFVQGGAHRRGFSKKRGEGSYCYFLSVKPICNKTECSKVPVKKRGSRGVFCEVVYQKRGGGAYGGSGESRPRRRVQFQKGRKLRLGRRSRLAVLKINRMCGVTFLRYETTREGEA